MKTMAVLLSVLLFVTTATASVQAGSQRHAGDGVRAGDSPGQTGHVLKILDKLKLTSEQKREVASILKKHREEIGNAATGIGEARMAFRDAMMAEEYSEEAMRQAAQGLGAQEEQLAMLIGQIMYEVRSILTPAQKARLNKIRERRAAKTKKTGESRLSGLDKWIAEHDK